MICWFQIRIQLSNLNLFVQTFQQYFSTILLFYPKRLFWNHKDYLFRQFQWTYYILDRKYRWLTAVLELINRNAHRKYDRISWFKYIFWRVKSKPTKYFDIYFDCPMNQVKLKVVDTKAATEAKKVKTLQEIKKAELKKVDVYQV